MEVGGYTFDFEQLVVDKNGNGMLSYTISNPDGVKDWYESGYGEINFNWYSNPNGGLVNPTIYSESGEELDKQIVAAFRYQYRYRTSCSGLFYRQSAGKMKDIRLDLIKAKR